MSYIITGGGKKITLKRLIIKGQFLVKMEKLKKLSY